MSARPSFPSLPPPAIEASDPSPPARVGTNLLLFGLTVVSVFHAGATFAMLQARASFDAIPGFLSGLVDPEFLVRGASFALPLLAILLTHEFGHFFAARYHKVPASLPYFLPAPGLAAGTFGAVISMRDRIRSRNALLDIGASGPLAGLLVAVPALAWGIAHSPLIEVQGTNYQQEGQSILYMVLKRLVVGEIPVGWDINLHPTAYAGWFGLLLTMVNLLPWGQLDGGHIAYALLGERHHALARWFRRALLGLFALNFGTALFPILFQDSERPLLLAIASSIFWLVWYLVLGLLARLSGGDEHPPFEPGKLSRGRVMVGWLCMALFVLLFMPTPMAIY